jgi:hypothetical protein
MDKKHPPNENGSASMPSPGADQQALTQPATGAADTGGSKPSKDPSLYDIIKSMTVREWVAVISTVILVLSTVSGAAGWVGRSIEKETRGTLIQTALAPIQADLKTSANNLEAAQGENARLRNANGAMERQMNILIARLQAEKAFTLFAEEYINYLAAPSSTTRNILADLVCKLYRDSQQASTNIRFTPVRVEEIVSGDFATSLDDLAASGYNINVLKDLRQLQMDGRVTRSMPELSQLIGRSVSPQISLQPQVSPQIILRPVSRSEDADPIIAQATKRIEGTTGSLIKIVTFPGHSPFTMPAPVAAQVHSDPSCRIR